MQPVQIFSTSLQLFLKETMHYFPQDFKYTLALTIQITSYMVAVNARMAAMEKYNKYHKLDGKGELIGLSNLLIAKKIKKNESEKMTRTFTHR